MSPAYIFYVRIQNMTEYKQVTFGYLQKWKLKISLKRNFTVMYSHTDSSNQINEVVQDNLNIRFEGQFIFK